MFSWTSRHWVSVLSAFAFAHHEDDIISIAYVQSQVLVHPLDLGVADIGAVEDAGEINEEEDGANHEVQLPDQSLLGLGDEIPLRRQRSSHPRGHSPQHAVDKRTENRQSEEAIPILPETRKFQ